MKLVVVEVGGGPCQQWRWQWPVKEGVSTSSVSKLLMFVSFFVYAKPLSGQCLGYS